MKDFYESELNSYVSMENTAEPEGFAASNGVRLNTFQLIKEKCCAEDTDSGAYILFKKILSVYVFVVLKLERVYVERMYTSYSLAVVLSMTT